MPEAAQDDWLVPKGTPSYWQAPFAAVLCGNREPASRHRPGDARWLSSRESAPQEVLMKTFCCAETGRASVRRRRLPLPLPQIRWLQPRFPAEFSSAAEFKIVGSPNRGRE